MLTYWRVSFWINFGAAVILAAAHDKFVLFSVAMMALCGYMIEVVKERNNE